MFKKLACLAFMLALVGSASADLVGHWPLDGDANDVSGNGLHGTIVLVDPNGVPNFIDGALGLALDFSGGNDYVNIDGYKGINIDPNDPDRVQPAFSVMNWFKVDTGAANGNVEMVTWGTSAGRQRLTWRVHQGRLRTEHASGNLRGNTYVDDGEWHHGALTVTEGANLRPDVTKLYVDGVEDTTFSGSNNPYELTEGVDVRFGMSGPQNGRYWPGALDDVRIFDHTLSTGEIREILGLLSAYDLAPANDALIEDTSVTLSWTPGPVATAHDVYFGTNPEPGAAELMGRQAEASYVAELAEDQTYYWRIDDIQPADDPNDPNAVIVHTGEVLSLTVPLMGAYDQDPPDGQGIRDLERTLSWTPGWSPLTHAVYFSTDSDEVTNGAVAPTILTRDAALDVGPLEPDTTYYWAVDEFYGDHWSVGPTLSFTTAPVVAADPNADPSLVAHWTLDEAPGGLVVDISGSGNHGEIVGGAQIVEGLEGGAIEFDGIDDYIDMGNNAIGGIFEPGGSAFTISAWVNPSELRSTVTNHNVSNVLLSRGSDPFNDNFELGISGDGNLILYTDTDGGDTTVTVGSGEITVGEWSQIVVVFDAGAVTALLNGASYETTVSGTNFDQAAGSPFTIGDTLHEEHPYSGLADDIRILNRAMTADDLRREFGNAAIASEPDPADGATGLSTIVSLMWKSGDGAVSHDLHIGTDLAAVEAGDAFAGNVPAAPVILGFGLPPDPFVGGLVPGTTYYWRIDEVDADGNVAQGNVWSFSL